MNAPTHKAGAPNSGTVVAVSHVMFTPQVSVTVVQLTFVPLVVQLTLCDSVNVVVVHAPVALLQLVVVVVMIDARTGAMNAMR